MGRLRISLLALLCCVALVSAAYAGGLPKPQSEDPKAQELIDKAWELDRSGSNPEIYKQCIELMEKANKIDPNNASILTDLSRYYWNYGDNLPKETDEQQERLEDIYNQGLEYAARSLEVKETVGGHYWYAVNRAASEEFNSIFSQAAAFPAVLKHDRYVDEQDPEYYYGASGRLWTEILVRVPKVVVKMVGYDPQEVVDEINESIEREPRYFDNYVYKARFIYNYYGEEKKEEALKLIEKVLEKDPGVFPEEKVANQVSQRDARELWKEITGKECPEK